MKYFKEIDKETNGKQKRYFHELDQSEIDTIISEKKTTGYIIENFKQPDWCNYPEALSMDFGCWSLCDLTKDGARTKISKEFCKSCECFSNAFGENWKEKAD